jgi:hypothetical protein
VDDRVRDRPALTRGAGRHAHQEVPDPGHAHGLAVARRGEHADHLGRRRGQEVLDRRPEDARDRDRGVDPGEVPPRLDRSDQLPAHPGADGQVLLRQPVGQPQLANATTEHLHP